MATRRTSTWQGVFGAVLGVCSLWSVAVAASSGPKTAALEYERGAAANDCPTERTVRDAVAARLGYDPFEEGSDRRVRVTLRAKSEASGYVAEIGVREGDQSSYRTRELETARGSCDTLVRTLVFTVSLVIDPASAGGGAEERPGDARRATMAALLRMHDAVDRGAAEAADEAEERAEREVDSGDTEPAPGESTDEVESSTDFQAFLGGGAALGTAPAVASAMVRGGVELAGEGWAVRASGRTELPTRYDLNPGELVTSLTAGTLDVCGRIAPMFVCASGMAGRLQLTGVDLVDEQSVGRLYAAVGAAAGADVTITERFSARFQGRIFATLIRTRAVVNQNAVWTTPGVSGALSAAVVFDF